MPDLIAESFGRPGGPGRVQPADPRRQKPAAAMNILGIETSCDETASAVVSDGRLVLSSIVYSQIGVHHPYGGVVPELASRKHIEAIVPVVDEAIRASGLRAADMDAVAVTRGPGLVGALLIGFSFAKAYAFARDIPWVGVNHLHGHIQSVFLGPEPVAFPFVALLASGGHTAVYYITSHTRIELMGQTRDDAAGEAFDKVAKMLGLGYPGGALIARLAQTGDPDRIRFPRTYLDKNGFDFSFSGIKSAVRRYLQTADGPLEIQLADIAAGFQESVVDVLTHKILWAAQQKGCGRLAVVGGVAANQRLRERVAREAAKKGIEVHIPSIPLCGDNAAMIAAAGYHHLISGETSEYRDDVFSRAAVR